VQVVAYDDSGGAIAARFWWMLRWLSHDAVAVLDDGWPQWQREGRPVTSGTESRTPRTFTPNPRPDLMVNTSDVEASLGNAASRLVDCRAADRYRGEVEPIDPVAGHIPGAISAPFSGNLGPDGLFRPPEELRARFRGLIGDIPIDRVICYCGSGVTATHTLLALAHAGLGEARLYAGSWSEWITDPDRPVETGSPR